MNPLYRILLRAKHWKLFIITFCLPMAATVTLCIFNIITITIAAGLPEGSVFRNAAVIEGVSHAAHIISLLGSVILISWYLAVGTQLRKLVPQEAKKRQCLFIASIIYMLVLTAYPAITRADMSLALSAAYMQSSTMGAMPDISAITPQIAAILTIFALMVLIGVFAYLYIVKYVAQTYKSAELGRKATFRDYMCDFFLFLFSFAGFWVCQPTINKMAEQLSPVPSPKQSTDTIADKMPDTAQDSQDSQDSKSTQDE